MITRIESNSLSPTRTKSSSTINTIMESDHTRSLVKKKIQI